MGDLWFDVLGKATSHGVTGDVYKAWVHIHVIIEEQEEK
jgi:hypothetical protein